mgnify:CR=1 FL=1|tara:strand:+ start:2708 stop:3979 length:1272 start_codon:yes stop_codon:yes gene_type:complete
MKLIKGFKDIYPLSDKVVENTSIFNSVKEIITEIAKRYNFQEIITPVIENKDTFTTGIGSDTDIVSKEMYDFYLFKEGKVDKSSIYSLRPEGTAAVIRSYIEQSMDKKRKINKLYYFGPMFRYERSQKGRYRQFNQMGIELIGSDNIYYEYEIISLAIDILENLEIKNFDLEINSIGNEQSLKKLSKEVIKFTEQNKSKINSDDLQIVKKNPLRFLDKAINKYNFKDVPRAEEFLDNNSKSRFKDLTDILDENKILYKINNQLVRGIDYYNDLVFEIKSSELGSQDTILAGGRYDNLVKKFNGSQTSCVGFAAGVERLLLLLSNQFIQKIEISTEFYVIYQNQSFQNYANEVTKMLRKLGKNVEMDQEYRSFTKQLKHANKIKSKKVVIIGEKEYKNKQILLKDMITGQEELFDIGKLSTKIT